MTRQSISMSDGETINGFNESLTNFCLLHKIACNFLAINSHITLYDEDTWQSDVT